MDRPIRRRCLIGVCIVAFLASLPSAFAPAPSSSEEPESTAVEGQAAELRTHRSQVYELRIYTAAPGRMEALNRRFREHTLRFFEKHGIKSVGYWTAEVQDDEQRLYYLVAYPDRESRDKMLVNGIAVDPEFRKVVEESEKGGKLTTRIESVILDPTDYSPLK